jgi:hypothetical protein
VEEANVEKMPKIVTKKFWHGVCRVFIPYECRLDLHSLLLLLEDHVQRPNPNKINFHIMDQFERAAI